MLGWVLGINGTENTLKPPPLIRQNPTGIRDFFLHRFAKVLLVYVLTGEVVLVTDGGEEVLRAGDAAGFKAGDRNGHCLQNRTNLEAQVLKSALAPRTTRRITQTLTWWHRPDMSRRSIRIVMARRTRTSGGALDAEQWALSIYALLLGPAS